MAKNISLSEEAYKRLSQEKRPNESFSDVILRFLSKKRNLKDVIGKKLIDPDLSFDTIRKAGKKSLERIVNESS